MLMLATAKSFPPVIPSWSMRAISRKFFTTTLP
jgi:hypothetical protein